MKKIKDIIKVPMGIYSACIYPSRIVKRTEKLNLVMVEIRRNGKFLTKAFFSQKKTEEELLEWITKYISKRESKNETDNHI